MCVLHGCIAEKINVKVSRYKKNVGFVRETVAKLRCTGSRDGGLVVSDIDSVQLYSPNPAPVYSSGRLTALGENDCDWWRENNEQDSRDVIGGKSECTL